MIALTIDREEEAAPFMFLNNPYMVSSSHNAVNRSCRVAVVRLESRVATRPVFDKRCLWGWGGEIGISTGEIKDGVGAYQPSYLLAYMPIKFA